VAKRKAFEATVYPLRNGKIKPSEIEDMHSFKDGHVLVKLRGNPQLQTSRKFIFNLTTEYHINDDIRRAAARMLGVRLADIKAVINEKKAGEKLKKESEEIARLRELSKKYGFDLLSTPSSRARAKIKSRSKKTDPTS
jgi:DNA topoisomerase VI subunit A